MANGDLIPLRKFMKRFKPAGHPASGFLPALRAYSGHKIWDIDSLASDESLGRIGSLEVRLARTASEVRRAQKLRYRVFYKEGSAIAEPGQVLAQRDIDAFDVICDHLLVIDHAAETKKLRRKSKVVGTYRLLRQNTAERHGGFYTSSEFAVEGLIAQHAGLRFLELGRSCVLPHYRTTRTVELLWQGIWAYVLRHRSDVMIGCASLDGTDPDKLALPLSFLHHFAPTADAWRASAKPDLYVPMDRMRKEDINPKEAMRMLPPLIKGYLRIGAYIGDGAVIDRQFGTTDVLIVLPVSAIRARYITHFGSGAERFAA